MIYASWTSIYASLPPLHAWLNSWTGHHSVVPAARRTPAAMLHAAKISPHATQTYKFASFPVFAGNSLYPQLHTRVHAAQTTSEAHTSKSQNKLETGNMNDSINMKNIEYGRMYFFGDVCNWCNQECDELHTCAARLYFQRVEKAKQALGSQNIKDLWNYQGSRLALRVLYNDIWGKPVPLLKWFGQQELNAKDDDIYTGNANPGKDYGHIAPKHETSELSDDNYSDSSSDTGLATPTTTSEVGSIEEKEVLLGWDELCNDLGVGFIW